ncbi:hypothetical protein HXX76_009382 [Chlamydomonas incerta]|uniref:Uncharacterized protein n=1 Tax=Chlamydomonas incerta TaxID=51695 RepID=A0A835SRJ0_CHLIN|nr:hypothetical protein HXX76_009382 [Chlamydomonas incerta]|eukprot:KAG2431889.1 hypothetical protein HXX76_009382 [Chlamydomonas incerta]
MSTASLLDLPPAVWAVHLGPRLSPRALAALRLASRDAAALLDGVLIRRLALLPTVSWVLQRQATARPALEPAAGSGGAQGSGSGGGSSCGAGAGAGAGQGREQQDRVEQHVDAAAEPADQSNVSMLLSQRFSDLEELFLKPASAHDFVRRIDLRSVLLVLLGPAAPPRLAALHLAGWPPPHTGPLCAALPAWCPWLHTLVLEGLLGGADDGGAANGGGGRRRGATGGGQPRGQGGGREARPQEDSGEGSGGDSGGEGGGQDGLFRGRAASDGDGDSGSSGQQSTAAGGAGGGLAAALAALPMLRRLSLRYGAAGGAAGSAVSRHRPPRACPDLSALTQLTALQLAGVVPNAATAASLAALTALASLHLELLCDGYDKGMQVLDLSRHTHLTSLVLRARAPGSAAADPLRLHHHHHHPLHPRRAPQPSPLPCPAPLRGTLQRLPPSLLSLAVDIPPWRPRLDAAAGWAEPGPPEPAASGTGAQQRRRGASAGAGVASAAEEATGGAAVGPPPLRLLACAPDLLPCLRELGLSVRALRAIRLVTLPSLASSGGGGFGYGGGGGGCLGMVQGCSSAATWELALPPCGAGCPCAAGCGLHRVDRARAHAGGRAGAAGGAVGAGTRAGGGSAPAACRSYSDGGAGVGTGGRSWLAGDGGGALGRDRRRLEALSNCAALAASSPPHPGADAVAALRLLPGHLIPLAVPLRAPSPQLQPEAAVAAAAVAAAVAAPAVAAPAEGRAGPADGLAAAASSSAASACAAVGRHLSYIEVSARVNQNSAAALLTILERAAAASLHAQLGAAPFGTGGAAGPDPRPAELGRSAAGAAAASGVESDSGGGEGSGGGLSLSLTLSLERNVNGAELLSDLAALQTKYGSSEYGSSSVTQAAGGLCGGGGGGGGDDGAGHCGSGPVGGGAAGIAIRHLALLDLSAQAAAFPRGYSNSSTAFAACTNAAAGDAQQPVLVGPQGPPLPALPLQALPMPLSLPPFFTALQALGHCLTTLTLQPVRNMLRPLAAALGSSSSTGGSSSSNSSSGCPALRLLRLHDVEEDGRSAAERPLLPRLGDLMLAFGGCSSTDIGSSSSSSSNGGAGGMSWEDGCLSLSDGAWLHATGPDAAAVDERRNAELEVGGDSGEDVGRAESDAAAGAASVLGAWAGSMPGAGGEAAASQAGVRAEAGGSCPGGDRGAARAIVVPQLQAWEVECLGREVEAVSGGRCGCILARS